MMVRSGMNLYNVIMDKSLTPEELSTLVEYFELLMEIDKNNKIQSEV